MLSYNHLTNVNKQYSYYLDLIQYNKYFKNEHPLMLYKQTKKLWMLIE